MFGKITENLKAVALQTIRNCTFEKEVSYFGASEKMNVLLPSGDEKYYSFWVRDAAMMIESGLVGNEEVKRYIEIIALCGQNGSETIQLKHGVSIPPFAVADHINYDAGAVYYPGTYSSSDDQGDGTFGFFPPFCDNFYFVLMVGQYVKQSGDAQILLQEYHGMPLWERLEKAFLAYNIDQATGLCVSDENLPVVDWGFVDTVKKSGKLLMASLLRYRAGTLLSDLLCQAGKEERRAAVACETEKIKQSIIDTFYDEKSGWFYSATGIGRQFDVWATAYAVFLGLTKEKKTLDALDAAYHDRTAVVDGYVRHILTWDDASADSAWESTITPKDEYQNGAYWATPTGWYAYALYLKNNNLAMLEDFLEHLKKYMDRGAPFEWIDEASEKFSGLRYGTSGVLPYVGMMKILEERVENC